MKRRKIIKKVSLLLFLVFSNCILDSCCRMDEICFSVDTIQVKHFTLNGNKEITFSEKVDANDYAFLISGGDLLTELCFLDINFGNKLYAFNCDEPSYQLKNLVTNISIISNVDLTTNFSAGSELKTLFKPIELNGDCKNSFEPRADCLRDYSLYEGVNTLEDAFNQLIVLNLYFEKEEIESREVLNLLSLNTTENIIKNAHSFKLVFEFEEGKSLEIELEEVFLK